MYQYPKTKTITCVLFFVGCVFFPAVGRTASVNDLIREGNKEFRKGNYAKAEEKYSKALEKDPESAIINFNLGTTYFKDKKFSEAKDFLQKSLLTNDEKLRVKSQYNLGNSYYELGIAKENEDLQGAISHVEKAIQYYNDALKLSPKDKDLQKNLDIAQKMLEELKKKQKKENDKKNGAGGEKSDENNQGQSKQDQNAEKKDQDTAKDADLNKDQNQQNQKDYQQAQSEKKDDSSQQDKNQDKAEESKDSKDSKSTAAGSDTQDQSGESKEGVAEGKVDKDQVTQKEAQMLLDDFQQNEQPQKLLNFYNKHRDSKPVLKDW